MNDNTTPLTLEGVAQQYVQLAVSNPFTSNQVYQIAKVFDRRSGIKELSDINLESLIRYRDETLSAVKPVTYNGYLKYLRMIGKFATEHGYLEKNWFQLLKMESEPEAPPKVIGQEELKTILTFLKDNPTRFNPGWFWETAIKFLYYTGLRRRQLVVLNWADVNIDGRTIKCRSEGSKTKREWTIPMDQRLTHPLRIYKALMEEHLDRAILSTEAVFNICLLNKRFLPPHNSVGRMKPEHFTRSFERIRKAAGIKIFSPHKMRHTMATELCNPADGSKPDIFTVQRILGHTSIKTTRGYVVTGLKRMEAEISTMPDI